MYLAIRTVSFYLCGQFHSLYKITQLFKSFNKHALDMKLDPVMAPILAKNRLRSYFDCDGHVINSTSHRWIGLDSINKEGILSIVLFLEDKFKISSIVKYRADRPIHMLLHTRQGEH